MLEWSPVCVTAPGQDPLSRGWTRGGEVRTIVAGSTIFSSYILCCKLTVSPLKIVAACYRRYRRCSFTCGRSGSVRKGQRRRASKAVPTPPSQTRHASRTALGYGPLLRFMRHRPANSQIYRKRRILVALAFRWKLDVHAKDALSLLHA